MEKPLKVRLHVLSPLHIGCDDVYEPTGFVIDEKRKKLIEFDQMDFIKELSTSDRQNFSALCMQGNISSIVNIYKFISDKHVNGREVDIASGILAHYKKVSSLSTRDEKSIKQELNQFVIGRTAYNPNTSQPYIPGSSLKGALRTGYLNKIAKDKGVRGRKDKAKELEKELLNGSFETDPFRMVKMSDFLPAGEIKTEIVYAVMKKKKTSDDKGLPQILEVIKSGASFEGILNIQNPNVNARIINPVSSKELLKSVNDFYLNLLKKELAVMKDIGSTEHIDITKFNGKLGKSIFLLRIGRHSGAEAITIEENRWIKISPPIKPLKFSDIGATTIWLASETSNPQSNDALIPFGWAVLELTDLDINNIYPKHIVEKKPTVTASVEITKQVSKMPDPPIIISWEKATLSWKPGSRTLTASSLTGKKAELTIGDDKSIVPESMHKKIFEKKAAVTCNVTIEQSGNAFRIMKVELV